MRKDTPTHKLLIFKEKEHHCFIEAPNNRSVNDQYSEDSTGNIKQI